MAPPPSPQHSPKPAAPLGRHFLAQHHKPKTLTPKAEEQLLAYPWPGNIRELANLIERLSILHPDEALDAPHLGLA